MGSASGVDPCLTFFSDVGIGNDLVALGVLAAREVKAALKRYADRLMYQKCLGAGGAPLDLEGMSRVAEQAPPPRPTAGRSLPARHLPVVADR
jgi:hypothetical protein